MFQINIWAIGRFIAPAIVWHSIRDTKKRHDMRGVFVRNVARWSTTNRGGIEPVVVHEIAVAAHKTAGVEPSKTAAELGRVRSVVGRDRSVAAVPSTGLVAGSMLAKVDDSLVNILDGRRGDSRCPFGCR